MRSSGLGSLIVLLALPGGGRSWIFTAAHVSKLRLPAARNALLSQPRGERVVLSSTYRDSKSERTRQADEKEHGSPIDGDAKEALNEVASRVVRVCVAGDDGTAAMLASELEETAAFVAEEGERDAARFLQQAAKLLRHEMPNPEGLSPTYLKAFDRLLSAVVGTVWRLGAEDQSEDDGRSYAEEQAARPGGGTGGGRSPGPVPTTAKRSFYEILGVAANVERSEIRRAFRAAALETHPDVNDAPDAADAFMMLSRAYEVLYNPQLRETYDRYGEEAVNAAGAGTSSPTDGRYSAADDEWAHLRRQAEKARGRKKGKRARAREQGAANAAAAAAGTDLDDHAVAGDSTLGAAEWTGWAGVPLAWRKGMAEFGDVVLYPLPESVRMEEDDGREMGVGIVVGRNIDRGDAARIPHDLLGLCEVAPLEQSADGRWREDEIAVSAYPHIEALKVIPISGFAKAAAGEGSGAWSLVGDYAEYSPQHYFEEIIL